MGQTLINMAEIPVTARVIGDPTVTVRQNGQITFSSVVRKALDGVGHVRILWDDERRGMVLVATDENKLPKGVSKNHLTPVGSTKKDKQRFISRSGIFRENRDGLRINYDYKKVGNQTFPATVKQTNAGEQAVAFTLPQSNTLTPKPKQTRHSNPKTATAGAGAAAGGASDAGAPALEEV